MKKNLLKSILMAVALVLGTTGAWADEITATLVHTASSYSQGTAGSFLSTVDAEKETVNNSNFAGTWAGAAYADFSFSIPDGQTIQSATLTFTGVGEKRNTRNTDVMYANADAALDYDALNAGNGNVNLDATKIVSVTFPKGDGATTEFTVDATDAVKAMATAGKSGIIFKLTGNPGGGFLMGKGSDVAPTLVITTVSASAQTSYTVKFTDAAGNELKEAAKYDVLIGNQATASAEDMAAFFNADNTMKYIYVSGNQNITAAENAESNVITLVFREAEKFAYTLKSNLGTTLKEGSDWEGETLKVAYPRYQNVDGTLYSIAAGDKTIGYYQRQFTLNENNHEETISYTAGESGVVFLAEAEDIETLTESTAANSNIRCSNGLCAYNAGEGDAVIATLPNGKYKLYTSVWGNATTEFVFKAGENQILSISSAGYILDGNSEEFELNAASTAITLGATDNAGRGIDFVYIIKTGDAELVAPAAAVGVMDFTKMTDLLLSTTSSTAGDITENKTLEADEFSVTISPKASGSTNNRFWSNNGVPQLRVYSGTVTVKAAAGKTLTKIKFDQSQWGGMTTTVGTIDAQTWTGEAEEVVFNVTSQCRINSITVGETPAEPVVDVANIAAFKALAAGTRAKLAVNGAKVTFSKGDNTYIEDETGALLLYQTGLTMTAGKAITGFINGAYTDYKGLAELTAIDVTPASEFTEADTELTATVMTVAEASDVANASKLVKLENVNIDADLQTIKQGEDEIAFYDKFGVMTNYTYPTVAKSIVGIINTTSGYNTFHPVSPDSVVAGEVVIPEAANIAEAKALAKMGTNTEIKLTLNGTKATVMSDMAMEGIIEDETGAIMVDYNIRKLIEAEGMALTGTLIANITKDRYGVYTMIASDNTANSQITQVAAEVTPTATTIADIKAATPGDIVAKYVSLENVDLRVEDGGWTKYYYLVDGDNEIELQDSYYIMPQDLSIFSKFESIRGVVAYDGYSGFVFAPYGEYKPVEKEFAKVENIATVLKNVAEGEYIELSLNDAQVTLYEQGRWATNIILEDETAGIQIQDMSGPSGNATIFTELGQTFNGSIVLQYVVQDGISTLVASSTSVSDKYTSEVKDVVAKDIAFAEAKSEINNMKLVKVSNIGTEVETIVDGEGENAYTYYIPYMTDGTTKLQLSDQFSKLTYGENNKPVLPEKCNITGYVMPFPLYNESWTEIIGVTDYFIPTLIEEVEEPEPVSDFRKWDFTAWSEETKANLAADAATVGPKEDGTYPAVTPWRTYEKVGGPTEAEPDHGGNAYWYGTAIDGSEELMANGVVIAEAKGLFFNKMAAGALAIGVNYPSTSLGTYEGPAYLWIGGSNNSFTIPNVKSGSKITIGIESHRNTDARGVTMTIDGAEIGRCVPKTYEVFDVTVPGQLTDETFSDVVLSNTNGCHIYFITVDATGNDGINDMNAVVKTINNDVYTINGVKVRNAGESLDGLAKGLYIIGGKKVVVK